MSEHEIPKGKLKMLVRKWQDEIIEETLDGNVVYKNGRVDGLQEAINDVRELIDDD